jgi:hypothetical protein
LLANRCREERLMQCRSLLLVASLRALLQSLSAAAAVQPARAPTCPQCESCRIAVRELPREGSVAARSNTS